MTRDILKRLNVKRVNYIKVINIVFLCLLLIPDWAGAQPADSSKAPRDSSKIKSSKLEKLKLRKERQKLLAELKLVAEGIKQGERTISLYRNSEFTPNTMFQLSQLYIKWGKLKYTLEMEKFDKKLALFDKGLLKEEPEEPRVEYGRSIKLCEGILEHFVDEIDYKESILYWYGICLFEDNDREKAAEVFKQLLTEFPETEYSDEVNFRIGENYFDLQRYEEAIAVYSKTIEKWDNPYFGMALYKLAWSHYKLNNYHKSISTFFYLLGDLDMLDSLNCEEMGRSKLDLRDETIEYIASSFTEIGGLEVANQFLDEMKATEEQVIPIVKNMADIYRKRSFYDHALDIYFDLLNKHPLYEKAPEIQYGIFECYNKLEKEKQAYQARETLIKNYHPKSKWGKIHRRPEHRELVKELVKHVDFILATPLLAKADDALSREDKQGAINIYREFIQKFSRDERAPRSIFNMAECYFDLQDYRMAAKTYLLLVKKYPPNEFTEDAAYNRVICYDQLYANETNPTPDVIKLTIGPKKTEIPVNSKAQKELLQVCHEFVKIIPSGDKTVEILLKSAQEFFNLQQFEVALGLLQRIMYEIKKKHHGYKFYSDAASIMAQIYYQQEKYKLAEKWYAIVSTTASDSGDLKDKSRKMMASSRFKIAENLMAQGDSLKAAREFERIAKLYAGSEVAEVATYDAAVQYEKAGQDYNAAKLFEMFGRRYPNSELTEQAFFRAGVLFQKLEKHKKAAQNFMNVYERDKTSAVAPDALFSAGLAYEAAEKWQLAASAFRRYLQDYKAEPAKTYELMYRDAHATFQSKDYVTAQQLLVNTLNYYHTLKSQNVPVDDYFAAHVSFLLAEIDFVYFSAVKLSPPLEINMQKKQIVLNALLQKYLETTKFKVADWTTAAFHKIGKAFEKFGESVMESPAPEGASEADLKVYWETVRAKLVVPLWQKALEYYESNDKLATEANIENKWVEETRERIAFLKEEIAAANGGTTAEKKVAN